MPQPSRTDPEPAGELFTLTAAERSTLLAVAPCVVPASAAMTAAARDTMVTLIQATLASRTPSMRRQFRLFLAVLRWAPLTRYARPLDRLDGRLQDAVLRWFQNHRLQVIRSGLWGVRTLVLLGYYGQPAIGPSIGYTPAFDGNAILHARTRH